MQQPTTFAPRAGWLARTIGLALLSSVGAHACSVEGDGTQAMRAPPPAAGGGGAGGGGAGAPTTSYSAELQALGEPRLLLSFGEEAVVTVRLSDREGDPLEDATIAFDLLGRPQGASLSALSASTDEQGIAAVTLRAGARAATFTLRASATRALPITFNVAISGAGFGTLIVQAPYDGERNVSERLVLAYPGLLCDEVTRMQSDPVSVIAPGEDSASLIALPAEVEYAVLVLGKGQGDTIVATGCVERVSVLADERIVIEVPFQDAPLVPARELELEMELEAGEVAATLAVTIRRASETLVRSNALGQNAPSGAEGRFWLDSLDAALRADNATTAQQQLADALIDARAKPAATTPDAALSTLLDLSDEGAQLAAATIATRVRIAMATLTLRGSLTIDPSTTLRVELAPETISSLPIAASSEAPLPSVDLSEQGAAVADARLRPALDALDLRELPLSLRFGSLAREALRRMTLPSNGGVRDDLIALSGCGSLAEWLTDQSFVNAASCDATCLARACKISIDRLIEAANTQLEALDAARPTASFTGTLQLDDDDGDLIAESMFGDDIAGEWLPQQGASLADSMVGEAQAVATERAP